MREAVGLGNQARTRLMPPGSDACLAAASIIGVERLSWTNKEHTVQKMHVTDAEAPQDEKMACLGSNRWLIVIKEAVGLCEMGHWELGQQVNNRVAGRLRANASLHVPQGQRQVAQGVRSESQEAQGVEESCCPKNMPS